MNSFWRSLSAMEMTKLMTSLTSFAVETASSWASSAMYLADIRCRGFSATFSNDGASFHVTTKGVPNIHEDDQPATGFIEKLNAQHTQVPRSYPRESVAWDS